MRIYNEIVFDVDGNVTYEDSFEYEGDVMLLKKDHPFDLNKDGGVNVMDIGIARDMERMGLADEGFAQKVADHVIGSKGVGAETEQGVSATALPSLPSISNVGAQSFSGSVNTQAIPGGFQPLPQTAGGRKKLYQLSKFHGGINQQSSPRDISDIECQEAVNVTVSQVGRIKLLGDCLNTNTIGADITADSITTNIAGYGLFQFTAPADHDGGVVGQTVFTCVADGDEVIVYNTPNSDGIQTGWISGLGTAATVPTGNTDDVTVAMVYYASGNGLYASDANFNHGNKKTAKIYVSRKDYDSGAAADAANLVTAGWYEGDPLIGPPSFDDGVGGGSTGVDNRVNVEWDDGTVSFTATTTVGSATVHIGSSGTGTWNGNYFFYISWLFDGGTETGLSALQETGGSYTNGFTFANEQLSFNFSVEDVSDASRNHIGNDARIEGARIYFKKSDGTERFVLAEVSLVNGVKGALDSTFTVWHETATDTFDLGLPIIFENPPEVYTYASLNGYYANEVYGRSPDTLPNGGSGAAAFEVRYRTVVVGTGGVVFIGNVLFNGKHMPDVMMFSPPGKPAVFPQFNTFDSPSSDGSPIIALAAYKDTILQFKENGMYVINVSNPAQFYAEASFRNCGVLNPCQVFTTSFGVIFVNKHGCFVFDGRSVISLTGGKFDWISQSNVIEDSTIPSGADQTARIPCIGYDPRSQSIIVLKNIGDDVGTSSAIDAGAWVYNMVTQSWTEGTDMITNGNGVRHSNFIITHDGYLAIKRNNDGTLLNYNHDMETGTNSSASAQTITYYTKDIDFGLPSQTKKIFKVYITYKGDCDGLTVKYRTDGTSVFRQFNSDDTPLADVAGVLTLATLTPSTASEATGITSLSIYMNGSIGVDASASFEINDISILYRVRPIK